MILEKEEIKITTLKSKIPDLQCFIHKKSFFVEGNLNNVSVHQELCHIYNALFNLNMKIVDSLNDNNSNLIIENLPYLFYGGFTIRKDYIFSFLNKLISMKDNKILLQNSNEIEIIKKLLLFDLQMSLNMYVYYNYHEKTNYLWKILKFLYQPFKTVLTFKKEKESLTEITKLLGITSKYEAVENIRKINKILEEFVIKLGGENYCNNITNREVNEIDILIYSAIKAQSRIFPGTKFHKQKLNEYPNINLLVSEIDGIILNKIQLKNEIKILLPSEINFPKFIFIDKNFGKYLDIPLETPEIVKRTKIRKSVISSLFFFSIIIAKLSQNTNK